MRWGLIPAWAKEAKLGDRAINARDVGEDGRPIEARPMFRDSWSTGRRCLLPLNSFFEWKAVDKVKRPFAIALADGSLMGVAGLWDQWRDPSSGEVVRSFAIITTTANESLAPIHTRMPMIIAPQDYGAWLAGTSDSAKALMRPCPSGWLKLWAVTPRVNKVGDLNEPECVAPLEA